MTWLLRRADQYIVNLVMNERREVVPESLGSLACVSVKRSYS